MHEILISNKVFLGALFCSRRSVFGKARAILNAGNEMIFSKSSVIRVAVVGCELV